MKDKIVIIGAGAGVTSALQNMGHDVVVVSPDEAKQMPLQKSEPFIIRNLHYPLKEVMTGDFVCKGKHQYREVKGVWVCQCGREL